MRSHFNWVCFKIKLDTVWNGITEGKKVADSAHTDDISFGDKIARRVETSYLQPRSPFTTGRKVVIVV